MKIPGTLALLATALFATAATAEPLPRVANEQAARCVTAVRAAVLSTGTFRIQHTITDIRTIGAQRAFVIESVVYAADEPAGRSFVSRCLAQRWGDGAELAWVRKSDGPAPGPAYVAKESSW